MVQEAWAEKTAQAVLMSDNSMYFVYDETVTVGSTYKEKTVSKVWSGDDVIYSNPGSPGWRDDDDAKKVTTVVFDISFASVRLTNSGYWFMGMNYLTNIEHIEYLNTSDVTSMFDMFAGCSKITTLDLSNFDTSKVTDMQSMFKNCSELTTIYVSNLWNTDKVTSSSEMFLGCQSLSGYNESNVNVNYAHVGSGGYLTEKVLATLLLNNDADNDAKIAAYSGQTKNVQLMGRTLYKDGYWNTLCLPFNVTMGSGQLEGATAMTLNASTSGFVPSTGVLTLNFIGVASGNTIDAGTPFIVKWTGTDVINPVFSEVAVSGTEAGSVLTTDENVRFQGTYSPTVIYSATHDNLYLGAENKIYWPNTDGYTLGAFRAYFHVDLTKPNGPGEVRSFILNFGDEETTGIREVTTPLAIRRGVGGEAWYDLNGRKLSGMPTTKGIYIHNGRKEVIR